MGKKCIGCGKAMGGLLGAYGVRLLYGEVCLTCNKKLNIIPSYQYLTPDQIKDVISGRVQKGDVVPPSQITHPGSGSARQATSAEQIRQYKELLDDGIITQEEYEEKKRQLLNS
ncbi:MAG: SHOCT domain-containing protein [Methanomassiliicoccaceae archaeon]|nr:SHOCT domain-containing protein [Methanomassiliicoccaceae archaeon]